MGLRVEDRFWSYVQKAEPTECWGWVGGRSGQGYGAFWFDGKLIPAHRMAYELVKGPIPDGAYLLHSCDQPSCVNPNHLRPGTPKENSEDMVLRDRQYQGAEHHFTPFTAEDIVALRAAYVDGESVDSIAQRTGVSATAIRNILRGKAWKSVTGGVSVLRRPTTKRDEILRLLAEGKTQVQVAAELGISQAAVSYHKTAAGT